MNTLNFAKETAKKTGEIINNFHGKTKSFNKEGAMNFVTEADFAADKFIKTEIAKNFPSHRILSEEDKIHEMQKVPDLWIIDPLDGTTNFKFQIPFFSISIAYLKNGEVNVGVVYDPIHNELFWAEQGKGAFLNSRYLKIEDKWNLDNSMISLDGSYKLNGMKKKLEIWDKLDQHPATIRLLGSAVLTIAYIATGRINLYFSDFVFPWDIAASSLIVQEAGGQVLDFDKKPFNLFTQGIIAGSPSLLSEFTKII